MNRTALLGLLFSGLLGGCASNVTLKTPTIPEPLLEQINMTVGVRMPAEFEHYVHEEMVYGHEEWSIDLGRSNAALFEQLFAYMFSNVTILGPDDDPQLMPLDALIEPSIDAFEFSTPGQSNTEAFAVWIRYRLKVFDPDGNLVSNWPVAAYGKSQTTKMGGSSALQRAAVLAMRDAAALMIMKFDNVTRISSLAGSATVPASPLVRRAMEKNEAAEATETTETTETIETIETIETTETTETTDDAEVQTTALEGNTDE
jgi:hypothetical protein